MEAELEEEFQFHIEQRVELEIAKGLSPDEARFQALRAMNGAQHAEGDAGGPGGDAAS